MQQQKQQEWGMRETTNLLYALANAHATAITVFLRHSFGKEALGWPGLGAFFLILVVAGFSGSPAMLTYLVVWLGALAYQRVYTFRLASRGVAWHSRYPGWPALAAMFTGGNRTAAVFLVEPFLCFCVGSAFISSGEVVVGRFILCGVTSLLIREAVHRMLDQRRVQAMRDAQIEQEWLAREFRNQG